MVNRYAVLFGSLGVLFAGYAVWWHGEAGRLEAALPRILASTLPKGVSLRQQGVDVDGFPFRLNVQLTDVRVSWGDDQWLATPSLTAIFQPFTDDHMILHLDAPIDFHIEGAQGSINAERALASIVGYEGGHYELDADSVDVTLSQPGAPQLKAKRAQAHILREEIGEPGKYAFALAVRNLSPRKAANGYLAELLARYGEPQPDGTVSLDIDEKDDVFHADGKTLGPSDAEALKGMF